MAKLCMGCMNPLPEDSLECKVCGFDITKDKNPEYSLPITTSLQGHYIVGRLMGEFPDHLLYLAYDRQMKEPCFIQEFFPATISRRDSIGGIQPLEGCDKVFEEYADRFRTTMRILARMRELPSIVPVYDIFEESGTVYAVSDYCQGMTLTKKIKLSGGRIPWTEARSIFMSLLSGLIQLSDAGICHLAICPDNILIGGDGKARLRNFSISSAHRAGTDLAADLKTGYAAPEQYFADGTVDASADVYGLAATIFRTVTGTEPPAGDNRAKNGDDLFMSAEVAEELTQPVCVALFNALQVVPERRTAGLAQLRDQLSITPQVSALVDEANDDIARADEPVVEDEEEETKSGKGGLIAMLVVALTLLLGAVVVIVMLLLNPPKTNKQGGPMDTGTGTSDTSEPSKTPPVIEEGDAMVPDVVGEVFEEKKDALFSGMSLELIGYDYDPAKEDGVILKQYPEANAVQDSSRPIYVVINKFGVESTTVKIPDLVGWDRAHAEYLLEKVLGMKLKTPIGLSQTDQKEGAICDVNPKVGDQVARGSEITLYYSTKKETKPVPNLVGASEPEVREALQMLGFVVKVEDGDPTGEDAVVESIAQAGTEQEIGSTIVIHTVPKDTAGSDLPPAIGGEIPNPIQ